MTSRAPVLTDGEVTLRAHHDGDLDAVVEQCRDEQSTRWTTVPVPYERSDAETFVHRVMPDGWATGSEWGFAVEHDGRFAGTVSLRDQGDRRAEVAYGAHPAARGHGVMERALRLLLGWGFAPVEDGGLGLGTVIWYAYPGNLASRRLAWKVGFSFDGTLRGWVDHHGELRDVWAGTLRAGEELRPRTPWLEAPTIHGERVVLRALVEADLPRVVETLNDPETQRWHERPRVQAPHTLESQADFVRVRHAQAASGTAVHWAVADPATDAYLGQMSLFGVVHRRQASLSYWTHPDARGRGLTQEAARLVVRHCFVDWEDGGLGLRRLWSDAELGNTASRRVLERVGFVQTGVDRASEPAADGGWADQARYDLLAGDLSADDPA